MFKTHSKHIAQLKQPNNFFLRSKPSPPKLLLERMEPNTLKVTSFKVSSQRHQTKELCFHQIKIEKRLN